MDGLPACIAVIAVDFLLADYWLMPLTTAPPARKHPAHPSPIAQWNTPTIIFITVCTAQRRPLLATEEAAALITTAWKKADAWLVGKFVIMPDHVHLFCAPVDSTISLAGWMRFWRSTISRAWPRRAELPLWQSGFWDTQLRQSESYDAKWEYVRTNPVRHGLVPRAEDWPYAGEVHTLEWT